MTLERSYDRVPIIELYNQLVVPLQGEITDELAEALTQDVLDRVRRTNADGVVVDLTGVWMLDSHLCHVLSNLATAAGLMGASTVLCGMNPDTAMTLQTMGIDLRTTRTALRLENALAMQGIRLVTEEP
jgi:rsbT antagonist protein RsbS